MDPLELHRKIHEHQQRVLDASVVWLETLEVFLPHDVPQSQLMPYQVERYKGLISAYHDFDRLEREAGGEFNRRRRTQEHVRAAFQHFTEQLEAIRSRPLLLQVLDQDQADQWLADRPDVAGIGSDLDYQVDSLRQLLGDYLEHGRYGALKIERKRKN